MGTVNSAYGIRADRKQVKSTGNGTETMETTSHPCRDTFHQELHRRHGVNQNITDLDQAETGLMGTFTQTSAFNRRTTEE